MDLIEQALKEESSNTSTEDIPAVDISALFDGCLKADGSISFRSALGRAYKIIRDVINEDRQTAAEDMLLNDLVMLQLFNRVLNYQILSKPNEMFKDGKINSLISRTFLSFMQARHGIMNKLLTLKKSKSKWGCGKTSDRDLDDLSFD